MRIIGGQLSGRTLVAPRGQTTRPTSDKVRQALFNILYSRGAQMDKVLDLFAGSGALGFEALSRGAGQVDFVEHDRHAVAAIQENAKALGLQAQIRIHPDRVAAWGKRQSGSAERYDLVFIDPPYADATAQAEALRLASEVLAGQGLVVVEHERMDELPSAVGALTKIDQRSYGQTALTFYHRGEVDG